MTHADAHPPTREATLSAARGGPPPLAACRCCCRYGTLRRRRVLCGDGPGWDQSGSVSASSYVGHRVIPLPLSRHRYTHRTRHGPRASGTVGRGARAERRKGLGFAKRANMYAFSTIRITTNVRGSCVVRRAYGAGPKGTSTKRRNELVSRTSPTASAAACPCTGMIRAVPISKEKSIRRRSRA